MKESDLICVHCGGKIGCGCYHERVGYHHSALPLNVRVADLLGWDRPKRLTLEWAIMALEEYCKKYNCHVELNLYPRDGVCCRLTTMGDYRCRPLPEVRKVPVPQAICEAIVAHAEGR